MLSLVQLRRSNTSVQWGFRMNGGVDFSQPLHIQKVTSDSVAFKAGLLPGDVIRQIGNASTRRMTHEQAKMEIIRAGNELDFFVHRGAMPVSETDNYPYTPEHTTSVYARTTVQDPAVQSRSLKVLQRSLLLE